MQLNSFSFFFFFLIVWGIVRLFNQRSILVRNLCLLAACSIFYASWDFSFLIWLFAIVLINYCGGIILEKSTLFRKGTITCIIVLSLLSLVLFKYSEFFLSAVFRFCGNPHPLLSFSSKLILPVGLSFFTFQALSYSIDVYRKKTSAEHSFINFAVFVSFFPTILSGPIAKGRDLLPQIKQKTAISLISFVCGGNQFIWGLFKKCVVADRLAQYVNEIYQLPDSFSGKSLALAAVCYSIQIYCDFSGYSDMAIGAAKAMGFSLKTNFEYPYFAKSIRDFWKRWHISLTSWFTEYLYISCGGNRIGKIHWMGNIMLVFLLSGLWHGANWTFLMWGGLHGVLYLIEYGIYRGEKQVSTNKMVNAIGGIVTFCCVTIAWIFFRSSNIQDAFIIIQRIVCSWNGQLRTGASTFSFVLMFCVTFMMLFIEVLLYRRKIIFDEAHAFAWNHVALSVVLLLCVELLAVPNTQFVYFLF